MKKPALLSGFFPEAALVSFCTLCLPFSRCSHRKSSRFLFVVFYPSFSPVLEPQRRMLNVESALSKMRSDVYFGKFYSHTKMTISTPYNSKCGIFSGVFRDFGNLNQDRTAFAAIWQVSYPSGDCQLLSSMEICAVLFQRPACRCQGIAVSGHRSAAIRALLPENAMPNFKTDGTCIACSSIP